MQPVNQDLPKFVNAFLTKHFMPGKSNKLLYILLFWTVQAFCQQHDKLAYSEGLAPAKGNSKGKESLYGFINDKGKFVIKPSYDTVLSGFKNGYAVVVRKSSAGLIDQKGKALIPFKFSAVGRPNQELIPVQDHKGLWGFYNFSGKPTIKCQYNNFRFRNYGKIIVQKDGFWGAISREGKNLVDTKYRELDVSDNNTYKAIVYEEWETRDIKNEPKQQFKFDSLQPAGKGLLKYRMIGKYGLVDLGNNKVTEYIYDSIGTERHGKFVVKVWDKYGVINRKGETVLPADYQQIIIDSAGIRAAIKNKEGKIWWGMYDPSGKELLSPNYPFLGEFGEGLVPAVAENGVWRYLDLKGETVIPFKFSKAGAFKDGLALVTDYKSDKQHFIDYRGEEVIAHDEIPFYHANLFWLDRNNRKIWRISRGQYEEFELLNPEVILVGKQGKRGLLSTDDKLLLPCKFDYVAEPSKEGFCAVKKGDKWGVVDKDGNFTLPMTDRFEKIFTFHEKYARVLVKGRYGFIDTRGNVYISPQYPDAGNTSDGMVAVKINDKWGFVNTDEKLKVQPYYDQVWPFINGCAIVYGNRKYNLVDKEGKELHKPLDGLKVTRTGKYLLERDGRYGLADEKGREILPVRYEMIREIEGGYFIVNLRGLYGVIDRNHNIKIPITFHYIQYDPFNDLFICAATEGQKTIKLDGQGKEQ